MLKITAVRTIPLRAPLDSPFWSATHVGLDPSYGAHASRSVLLVEVETADGLVGLGQCVSAGKNLQALDVLIRDDLAGYLIGEDAFARERIWETARAYSPKTALRVAEHLADLDVLFFEEPTNPGDLEGRRWSRPAARSRSPATRPSTPAMVTANGSLHNRLTLRWTDLDL